MMILWKRIRSILLCAVNQILDMLLYLCGSVQAGVLYFYVYGLFLFLFVLL